MNEKDLNEEGLYFQNNLKTRDKVSLSPEASRLFDATHPLFEEAKQAKDLNPEQMASLDNIVEAKLSNLLDINANPASGPNNSTPTKP